MATQWEKTYYPTQWYVQFFVASTGIISRSYVLYIFTYEWFGFWNVCVWGTVCPFSCLFLFSFPFLAFSARLPFAFLCLLFLASLPFLFLSSSLYFLSFSFPLLLMFCPFPFLFFSLFCHFFSAGAKPRVMIQHPPKVIPLLGTRQNQKKMFDIFCQWLIWREIGRFIIQTASLFHHPMD